MSEGRLLALHGPYDARVHTYPLPEVGEEGVLLKIEAALICGSDGHFVTFSRERPFCWGHEFVGRVVKLGNKANNVIHCFGGPLEIGDRVAVYPHVVCGQCEACLTHGNGTCGVCERDFLYGGPDLSGMNDPYLNTDPDVAPHFKGGFSEYVYLFPNTFVWKLPEGMPAKIAALMDPLAVALRGIELAMSGSAGETVGPHTRALVIGAGPIGILAAMVLRTMGVEQLIITDQVARKLELAKEISGADLTLNLRGMDSAERIRLVREHTCGGPHLVLQCANHRSASLEGLKMVRTLGTYVEIGMPMVLDPEHPVRSDVDLAEYIFEKNVRVCGMNTNTVGCFNRAFRLLQRYREIPFEKLITHEFHTLEDVIPTIRRMREEGYLKGALILEDK